MGVSPGLEPLVNGTPEDHLVLTNGVSESREPLRNRKPTEDVVLSKYVCNMFWVSFEKHPSVI